MSLVGPAAAGAYDGLSGASCARQSATIYGPPAGTGTCGCTGTDHTNQPVDWSDPAALADYWRQVALDNHGVYRVERLPGNIGYLDPRRTTRGRGLTLGLGGVWGQGIIVNNPVGPFGGP